MDGLPEGWTVEKSGDGFLVRDERGAPTCMEDTEEEAIETARQVAKDIEAEQ